MFLILCETRKDAFDKELKYQLENNVLNDENYINRSLARVNGFFGNDVSGYKNPMYGKSRKGVKHRGGENISKALKELYASDIGKEKRIKISERMTGNNHPMYGKKHSEETKNLMASKRQGENHPMYGKKHSEETKNLMSENMKGRISSNKGKKMSDEQKNKLKKPKTEEHKQKMRKTYIVNGVIIENAKLFCEENELNYTRFIIAASSGKKYKEFKIERMKKL